MTFNGVRPKVVSTGYSTVVSTCGDGIAVASSLGGSTGLDTRESEGDDLLDEASSDAVAAMVDSSGAVVL